MAVSVRLRERHKEQTRELITGTAANLFAARGFEAVTVAEVARAAGVSHMTVFNHFPTKEDLFFAKMEFFEERLLDAVRERDASVSPLEAFRDVVLDGCRNLVPSENADRIKRASTVIVASPSLQVREREIVARYTQQLAEVLALESRTEPDDVEAWAVATALMGVHRSLVAFTRRSVLSGGRGQQLARTVRSQARRAFARLEGGLADYGGAKASDRGRP